MRNVLVTGGGGFVGSALVRQLIEKGCTVAVAGRNRYGHIEQLGATCLVGDISDPVFASNICRNVDTVFHVAAKAGIWGDWQEYKKINIEGTISIVESCKNSGVSCLVYTSTPSVVFEGNNIIDGDETLPYTEKFLCNYSKSKVIAEQYVLISTDEQLRTCAIRPHLVWGPGDPHLIPRLIERGKSGKLKIIGAGDNKVDITYVDNAAYAHVLAAESLHQSSRFSGQAYFIGQERPVCLWDWINELYQDLGIEPLLKKVPFVAAFIGGWILEMLHRLPAVRTEPQMTRFLALQLARSHYFSHRKAELEIGYIPIINLEEGKKRLIESISNHGM